MKFAVPDNAALAARLRRPAGPVKVVLDTDTYNEIDDQYAWPIWCAAACPSWASTPPPSATSTPPPLRRG